MPAAAFCASSQPARTTGQAGPRTVVRQ